MRLSTAQQMAVLQGHTVPAASTAFTPASITGLAAWYDATVGVTGTSEVTAWADQSGNSLNLAKLGTGPVSGSATINGLNAITFDHSSTGMTKTGITVTATNTGTWFAVVKPEANTTNFGRRAVFYKTGGADFENADSIAAFLRDGTNQNISAYYNSVQLNSKAMTNAAAHQITAQRNGDSYVTRVDGSAGTTNTGLGTANFTIQNINLGVSTANDARYGMDLGELLWYNAAVSAGNIALIEAYLKAKWATP